jgi:hypothetical protein
MRNYRFCEKEFAAGYQTSFPKRWRLAFGVWRLAFGVWRLAFGVWHSAFGGVSGTHETRLLVVGMERPLDNRQTTLNPWPGDGTDAIDCRPSFAAVPGNLKR